MGLGMERKAENNRGREEGMCQGVAIGLVLGKQARGCAGMLAGGAQ